MSTDLSELSHDFTPYGQLVAALLPRAAGLSIFDADGSLRWTSDEAVDPQLPELVARAAKLVVLNNEPGERAQLRNDEPVYLFWLRDAQRRIIAVMCVRWRSAESDPRTFAYVYGMLRPVIECLWRELQLQARLAGNGALPVADGDRGADADDADLKVLLSTSEGSSDSDIAMQLDQVTMHLHCELTALLVPERNVLVVTKAPGCQVENTVLVRAHRHLVSLAHVSKEALLLNEPGSLPGIDLPLRALVSTVRNPAGRVSALLVLFRKLQAPPFRRRDGLLADLLARRAAAVIEARYDSLTGLFTRDAFELRVRQLIASRPEGPWTFLYIDADRLHSINDNHGMQVGDCLLMKLGELIRSRLMPGGVAARVSGDRFAILLPAVEADAMNFAEGLRSAIAALTPAALGAAPEPKLSSSLSVGVAPFTASDADPRVVLGAAESACRAAKHRGRNRVELYSPGVNTTMVTQVAAALPCADADAVRTILEGGRLCLHAQLIAPLPACSDPTPHFELLLRVQDQQGKPVGPGRFLAEARSLNLMSAVDRWVVRETLAQLKPRAALLAGGAVVLTINISGHSLAEEQFADWLVAQVRDSGIDPQALCFEFCEGEVMEHPVAEKLMHQLRALGCRIALDDFGTGNASLANLRALPLTMLKIDGSFVRDVLKNPRAEAMVQGLTHLARSAGFLSVAEGVETDEVRLRLTSMGADFAQGFAVGRPVPLADALRDLPTWVSVARQRHGGDLELGDEDDTVSAALQQELRRELLARGLPPMDADEDIEAMMKRLFADDGVVAAPAPERVPAPLPEEHVAAAARDTAGEAGASGQPRFSGTDPAEEHGDELYSHRAAG
jgi:diguanylate cyclase (GGDEF)-like protein